jgi:4,5-dihydroxyphthalate decarboxylase
MSKTLSIVLGPHGQVQDLRSGAVRVDGFDLSFTEVKRMPDVYRAMARTQPYEVCEMAPTAYLMARAAGAPLTALPLPMTRRFRHAGVECLRDGAVHHPKDLKGRAVGLRTYSVTAAVWTRGIYADEYGLDPGDVTWLTQEEENLPDFVLPPNVRNVGKDVSFATMLRAGEVDAVFAGLAGGAEGLEDELVDLVDNAAIRNCRSRCSTRSAKPRPIIWQAFVRDRPMGPKTNVTGSSKRWLAIRCRTVSKRTARRWKRWCAMRIRSG